MMGILVPIIAMPKLPKNNDLTLLLKPMVE